MGSAARFGLGDAMTDLRCPRCREEKKITMHYAAGAMMHECERCGETFGDVLAYHQASAKIGQGRAEPPPGIPDIGLVYHADGSVAWPGVITIVGGGR
jgi:Zn ribbon nucleic-acid-binding protein